MNSLCLVLAYYKLSYRYFTPKYVMKYFYATQSSLVASQKILRLLENSKLYCLFIASFTAVRRNVLG